MTSTVQQKRARFRQLHQQGTLVLPNPWDVGGVRRLEKLGAKAIATSSAAFAWASGLEDFQPGRDAILEHLRTLSAATDLPVNADFESGFADSPDELATNVKLAVATGIAGLSIEDRSGDALYSRELSIARIRAAKTAIAETGEDVILVARSEGLLIGTADLAETIARLKDYASAGADVVYAPGIQQSEDIKQLVDAVSPMPVNVLLLGPQMRVKDLASLGVRRVSTGFGLASAAWRAFEAAAESVIAGENLPG